MNLFGKVLKGVGKLALNVASEALAQAQNTSYQNATKNGQKIGGKTISEWDREWRRVGILSKINLSQ
jgi:hypothetical protein